MTSLTRRQTLGRTLAGLSTIALAPTFARIAHAGDGAIDWQAWRTDANDFFRAPILLTGDEEALLIDGSFNFPQGRALAEAIKATGKRLSTIYISCSDPDYYFSLTPVKAAFPDAKVIAATATIEAINANVEKKIDVWGPKLGENGPQSLDEIVFAEAYDQPTLDLEGETIDIVTSSELENRRYLWVPSLEAALGGVYTFEGLHVWTADTPTPEERAAHVRELDALIARNPKIVVAGHAAEGTNNGVACLTFTRDYLLAYEEQVTKAKDSAELIAAMKDLYPGLGLEAGLEIGAKVTKGEMTWG